MERLLRVTVLALALSLSAPAAGRLPEFSATRIKAHVTFLSDDLLEGREAGTRGHEIAARYIADQFAQIGVAPGGADGTYFERAEFSEASPEGNASLVVHAGDATRTFTHGDKIFVQGPVAGGSADLTASLVYVRYGISDAALGIDDYKGIDAAGKIVVAVWATPKTIGSEIAAHLMKIAPRVAAEHGAVGFIGIATSIPWPIVQQVGRAPVTAWVDRQGHPVDAGGVKAFALLSPDAAPDLFRAAPHAFDEIREAVEKGGAVPASFDLHATATLTAATKTRRFSSPEVIGRIEGADPGLKDEYVVLMAHADHIGMLPEGAADRINNGALDNAAGIAMLLEVGRAFASNPVRPRRSVLLVANTAEEKGLLGAEFFAHNPTVPIDHISAAVDLDMPLLTYDFTDVVAYGAAHSTVERAFRDAGKAMSVSLSPDPMPEQAVFVRSDHYPMVKAGVPAVMLATGMANGGKRAWDDFLANHYHRPSDDVSQPIVWQAGAKFAELNYRAVRILADADTPARWYKADYFGNLYAPNAPKVPRH
jgi:Zn-dependent M28 family amino/carboxypeptidase